jgi:hypothetical protein
MACDTDHYQVCVRGLLLLLISVLSLWSLPLLRAQTEKQKGSSPKTLKNEQIFQNSITVKWLKWSFQGHCVSLDSGGRGGLKETSSKLNQKTGKPTGSLA